MRKKTGTAMVIGAGISGIRSALDLAEFGYQVTLLDKAPHIGGILSQLDYQFPSDGCGMCKMLPLLDRDAASQYCLRKGLFHENIRIILGAELTALEGEPGNFTATIHRRPTSVDPDRCIGCGECSRVCPVAVKDDFNMGLSLRKAAFLPVPHNIPNTYVIDFAHCTRCGECITACPTGAIRFPEEKRKRFHILVVDDELIVRDSLKEWLGHEGFSVDMAGSGRAALDLLSKKTYHLMLTDIKMPGMDGVELLKRATKDYPDLSIAMMTAYATIETAIEAMKTGAMDYLLKPFDPETFTPKILEIYQSLDVTEEIKINTHALVLSTGTDYFDPRESKNTFGYGMLADVVTSREFERILSGTGPCGGHLVRQSDQGEVKRIAWFQCVGSRDRQVDADFCSSVCCMHAVKEARLVKEKFGTPIETTIFYMDMRAFGKAFHSYIDEAKEDYNIRFENSRVHSVIEDRTAGGLLVRYSDQEGQCQTESFDLIVLSIGQRPSKAAAELSKIADLEVNQWGFCRPKPFSTCAANTEGIFFGGSFTGLKDISESVICASAAALSASRFIHSKGGSICIEPDDPTPFQDTSRELPRILAVVCTCGQAGLVHLDENRIRQALKKDPALDDVMFMDKACTAQGWDEVAQAVLASRTNRVLISACLPHAYTGRIKNLARKTRIQPCLIQMIDIRPSDHSASDNANGSDLTDWVQEKLEAGFSSLKRSDPPTPHTQPSIQHALVVGGGISGMTAALAIADHGFEVDLIEKHKELGGNLAWLSQTIDGHDVKPFLEQIIEKIENHPLVHVHTRSAVTSSFGFPGQFMTTFESKEEDAPKTVEHGAAILATGGAEARTTSYGYGTSPLVLTHKELDQGLGSGRIKPEELESVVMIQCVDSREKPEKNYCSRVCCASALKYALQMKKANPEVAVYILYRDIMAYGFLETYYTRARQNDVLFIRYDLDKKPEVAVRESHVTVKAFDPILSRPLEIHADLLVLATGISPVFPSDISAHFGVHNDASGFFDEADAKWRPVDALKEGVFACGLCHSPRNIPEAVASAQAAAQRALRLLGHTRLVPGSPVALVHHSLCSLCERCIETCPYGARTLDPDAEQVVVNPVMCQGCGACSAVCPNSASVLAGFKDQQVFDTIDSLI